MQAGGLHYPIQKLRDWLSRNRQFTVLLQPALNYLIFLNPVIYPQVASEEIEALSFDFFLLKMGAI